MGGIFIESPGFEKTKELLLQEFAKEIEKQFEIRRKEYEYLHEIYGKENKEIKE